MLNLYVRRGLRKCFTGQSITNFLYYLFTKNLNYKNKIKMTEIPQQKLNIIKDPTLVLILEHLLIIILVVFK